MNKYLGIILMYLTISIKVYCQDTIIMPVSGNGGFFNSCYAVIYDNGVDSNYHNLSHSTITISPLWVQTVSVFFEEFHTENFFDSLTIYDGPGIAFTKIGSYSGTSLQGQTISSTGNSMTLEFLSDDIQTFSGFKAWVSCLMGTEQISSKNIKIYPNPTKDKITMDGLDTDKICDFRLFDILGKEIFIGSVNKSSLDLADLDPGIYSVYISLVNGDIIQKKIIRE